MFPWAISKNFSCSYYSLTKPKQNEKKFPCGKGTTDLTWCLSVHFSRLTIFWKAHILKRKRGDRTNNFRRARYELGTIWPYSLSTKKIAKRENWFFCLLSLTLAHCWRFLRHEGFIGMYIPTIYRLYRNIIGPKYCESRFPFSIETFILSPFDVEP